MMCVLIMELDMPKANKAKVKGEASQGTRVLDEADAARFALAADAYVAANTTSQSAARKKLQELGFIDSSGKPTKHYR